MPSARLVSGRHDSRPAHPSDRSGQLQRVEREKAVNPIDWVESFLVEPSLNRGSGPSAYTNSGDIYVEIIRRLSNGSGGSGPQFVRHDRPYLSR